MLTSKQLLEKTGISRATLNNYIALGILQKPLVKRVHERDKRTPRIGYFPDEALERINEVHRLKKQGLSIAAISKQLSNLPYPATEEFESAPEDSRPDIITTYPVQDQDQVLSVTIDNLPGVAYMVNNNFELTWWNDLAEDTLFNPGQNIQSDGESQSIFSVLMNSDFIRKSSNLQEIISIHMGVAKSKFNHNNLNQIYSSLLAGDAKYISEIYESVEPITQRPIAHFATDIRNRTGQVNQYCLYVSFFREGILFTYVPTDNADGLLSLLSRRDFVIRELLKKRKPFLTDLAVMVADLQNSVQICAELPPEEYFELINHIWQSAEPVFRKYYGTHGKHVGDGMVYYFFPQPDSNYILNACYCAHELKEMIHKLSREWQSSKNWQYNLYLNIGLNEGQEWFGTFQNGTNLEFTVLGDTINYSARLSDFAKDGSIWATKNMLGKLTPNERKHIRYGIKRITKNGEDIFVNNIYARISNMVDLDEGQNYKLNDIATLPVTEIMDIII